MIEIFHHHCTSSSFVSPLKVTLFDFFFFSNTKGKDFSYSILKLSISGSIFSLVVVYTLGLSGFFYLKTEADMDSFKIDFFGFFSESLLISYLMRAKCSSESSVLNSITSKLPNLTRDGTFYIYSFSSILLLYLLSELNPSLLDELILSLLILFRRLLLSGYR